MPPVRVGRRAGLLALGVACLAMAVTGCDSGLGRGSKDMVAAESTTQSADMVDLTIYFRQGQGPNAYLVPVTRAVPITQDLPKAALDLLIQGPPDGDGLQPVLPRSTRVQNLHVNRDTAVVDLSREVVADADSVGRRPEHEALALAAIADTLTEFPDITRVRLTVDGKPGGKFWGAWELPDILVRDERVIEPASQGYLAPQPEGFSRRVQRLGVSQSAPPIVTAVRARPSATFIRVTVEVKGKDGSDLIGPFPQSRARQVGGDIVLTVKGRPRGVHDGDLAATFHDPAIEAARVVQSNDAVMITVTPATSRPFKLHALPGPTRVVLDIRR